MALERGDIKSRFQALVLILPFLLFPVVVADLVSIVQLPPIERLVVSAVQNILFFNTLHVAITFFILVRYRQFREAIAASTEGHRSRFFVICFALVAMGPLLYMPAREGSGFSLYAVETGTADIIFRVVYSFLAVNHAIWQVRGIGMSYGRSESQSSIKIDKRLFITLIGSILAARGILFLLPYDGWVAVQVAFSIFSFLVALALVFHCWRSGQKLRAAFYFRLFYFPLIPFSTAAAFITPCFHGLEYIDYFRRMKTVGSFRQDLSWQMRVLAIGVVVIPSLIFLTPYLGFLAGSFAVVQSPIISFFIGIHFGLGFLHYYLDEKIFLFSNPKTRAALGPFFSKSSSLEAASWKS